MKIEKFLRAAALFTSLAMCLSSCFENEDPGPLQEQEKEFTVVDFDRLEISDGLHVTVEQGSAFSVKVKGDRRNIDDLQIRNMDGTLRIKFDHDGRIENRRHTTYVTIIMPGLNGVSFSGAVKSNISGFETDGKFDIDLSGAVTVDISGAANDLDAKLSGASTLRGFDFETGTASIDASGASKVEVLATQSLNVKASGASKIRYRGNPSLKVSVSGASEIGED